MIPVTDEMVQLAVDKFLSVPAVTIGEIDASMREALAAVLAIAERDHLRPADPAPDRCSACGRTARQLTPVYEAVEGRSTVVARLGPSCYRRAAQATQAALPIGGER